MKYIEIKKIHKNHQAYLEQELTVAGWLRTIRQSKNQSFMEINDGSFFKSLQVVFSKDLVNYSEVIKLFPGASLEISGKLIKSPATGQVFELIASKIEILGQSEADYPLQKKGHSFEFLRSIAHLRSRTNTFSAVFRLRSVLSLALHKFFEDKGFVYVHTPIISTSDCEGAGEMFQVSTLDLKKVPIKENGEVDFSQDFFGQKTGLTVSGQLQSEALIPGLNKVYTFGPTFRAENSNTTRHVSEFWMFEPEIAMAEIDDIMELSEEMLKYLIKTIFEKLPEEMEFFYKFIDKDLKARLEAILKADFARISYSEAIEILEKSSEKFEHPVSWGIDLQSEHERYIVEKVLKRPAFVYNYPSNIKAFYMRENEDNKTVAAVDLLVPGIGELIGGSQREERYDVLKKRLKMFSLDEKEYAWYLDLRRYGTVKHAGFGLGFERLIMYLSGMKNIRDVICFPRTPKNAKF
jgi:asparaginyl-tRNA synthetase